MALLAAGAEPVLSEALMDSLACDGLLLPGGADIDPALYGQKNDCARGIDPAKDALECGLLQLFRGKPILGICRGHQLIHACFGGVLLQDVPGHSGTADGADSVHAVTAAVPSVLSVAYGTCFTVNSAHHQAVQVPGKGFAVLALASDGCIEAAQNPEERILTVQWHPERMCCDQRRNDTVDGMAIFSTFLQMMNG